MNDPSVQKQTTPRYDVLIQGAGIGGLTLAIALQQRGYLVKVIERSAGLSEVGAGIWMSPNPMQVFDRLGFASKIADAGWTIKILKLQDADAGSLQTTDMAEISRKFGFETVALHRAVLQRVLFEQLAQGTVLFSTKVRSLTDQNDSVSVSLSDNTSYEARIVIGADGINSQIRQSARLGGEKRYSGSSSYRAIAHDARILLPEAHHEAYEIWAKGCRVGFSKINATDYYWYMTFEALAGQSFSLDETRAHAESLFRRFFPQWTNLLTSTRTEDILRTDIFDLKPLPRWSVGRIGLVGDAAHATTPNLGQGGAMAVEDALSLADALDRHGVTESALQRFEQHRREKVTWTVKTSWSIGKVCHAGNPVLRALRNAVLRHTPRNITEKQINRLYSLAHEGS